MTDTLNRLKPPAGSVRARRRVGRGPGSGRGKTASRGQKGAGSRAGATTKPGFEGGQMPLQRRLPKRGFTNIFKKHFQVVNVGALTGFKTGSVVDAAAMAGSGLVRSGKTPVKVLGEGEITSKLTVRAAAFSEQARSKIEAAGGKAETI